MASTSIKLETLRGYIWKLDGKIEELKKESELIKKQLSQFESIENENSAIGVEAEIYLNRILTRRGSKSKKLALAEAINKSKK